MDFTPATPSRGPGGWPSRAVGLAIILLISWFYLWTVVPEGKLQPFGREGGGYYNLLTRGFCKGQLSLDQPADPVLATLQHPYDPIERGEHGMHDVTYFNGRYYLYFGVTPVLVLFAPVRVLTGWFIDESYAALIFSLAGFWISVAVMREVRRRWLAGAPGWLVAASALVLGLATMVPSMLRRPSVWEVPISCAYAMFMAALFCVVRAGAGKHRRAWLAAASVAMGLCIGARPTYIAVGAMILVPLVSVAGGWRRRGWWRDAACVLVPIAAIGVGLAAYNFFRFGKISEFGWTYMMAGNDNSSAQALSLPMLVCNLRIYLLCAAGWSPFFPFVTVITAPPLPYGHIGVENPYGLLPNEPWIWCTAGVVWLVCARRTSRELRWFCGGLLGAGVASLLLVSCFCFAANRYQVDFTPCWMLLGCIGAAALLVRATGLWRRLVAAGIVVLAGWSAVFGALVGMQHNQLLRVEHPALYARVAHAFNRPADLLDRILGAHYGPVELKVVFPKGMIGQIDPLVATGHEFLSDYVYVHYLDETTVRFGFEHAGRGGSVGPPVKIVPGVPHTVRVDMGSLYPPAAHPWFDRMTALERRVRQRVLRVTLDGQVAFECVASFYDGADRNPSIGTTEKRWGSRRDFSGQLLDWRRLPADVEGPILANFGELWMRMRFPPFIGKRSEPLLSSGETGKGDLVFVTYVDAKHITFGHDRWRYGGATSEKIEIDPAADHVLEIACPPLLGPGSPRGLRVRLDGREVFATDEEFYPCERDTVIPCINEIGASTAGRQFSGEIFAARRVAP